MTGWNLSFFRAERDAYAHLVHSGACDKGVVPRCYGWIRFSKQRIQRLGIFGSHAYATVLEYMKDAEPISSRNITIDIADKALRGLYAIHTAFVVHNDVIDAPRNILVLPGDRVVWVDFDMARCGDHPLIQPAALIEELAAAWQLFYNILVSTSGISYYHL